MIQCLSYLTPILPVYVVSIILIILNETVIGGSVPGEFASCAHTVNWRNILKKQCVGSFSLVSSPQVSSFFFEQVTQAQRHLYCKSFFFPKRLSFHKGWCCGSQWKRIAEFSRVVWVVGGGGFCGKWWVPFGALLGCTLVGIVVGWLKVIHTTKIWPVGYRPKHLFERG